MKPDIIHLTAPANPLEPEARKFGFADVGEYLDFARRHVPPPYRVRYSRQVLRAVEREFHGGRNDDAVRIRDLNAALRDPRTAAIVATNGGAYLARILPHVDFTPLDRRREPLWLMGFSEISSLVNIVASYRCGRGLYWLGPNYLNSKIKPVQAARDALAEFWRTLPVVLLGRAPRRTQYIPFGPIIGERISGKMASARIRLVGGCLSVLCAVAGGVIGARIRPRRGQWLMIEDIKESPYRLDRMLATLKIAGWFDQLGGVLVGDFVSGHTDTQQAVLELLPYHLPRRDVPIVTTRSFGHTWPLVPVPVNRPLAIRACGRRVEIETLPTE